MVKREFLNRKVKVVNKKTGEIREAELTKVYSITNSDKFYQMYTNGVTAVLGLKPELCDYVYMWLCANQNNNFISVNKVRRKKIAEECNISEPSVVRALKILTDNGILKRETKGNYILNPWYSWSGTANDRNALLENARVSIRIDITPDEEIYEIKDEIEESFNNQYNQ